MDLALRFFQASQLHQINYFCLFLQAHTIDNIASTDDTKLLPCAYTGTKDPDCQNSYGWPLCKQPLP
jgi:hypothetical protein